MVEFATSKFCRESKKIRTLQTNDLSSKCELIELGNKLYVTKFIGKQFGGLSIKRIKQLNSKCTIYYQKLKAIGIPVPSFFRNYIQTENITEGALLVNINNYCGQDLSSIVRQCKLDEYILLVKHVLNSIKIIILNNFKQGVSIDPNLDNFVAGSKSRVTYVDFCPPLINEDGSGLKLWQIRRADEHDQDSQIKNQRYFTIQGLLLLFIIRAWSKKLEYGKYLISAFINFSKELSKIQQELIFQSTFYQILIRYRKNKVNRRFFEQIIRQAKPADRDLLRLIFLIKISQNENLAKKYLIEDIFREYKSPSNFQEFQSFLLEKLL